MQYYTVQCSTILQYSTIQYSAVLYNTVQYYTVHKELYSPTSWYNSGYLNICCVGPFGCLFSHFWPFTNPSWAFGDQKPVFSLKTNFQMNHLNILVLSWWGPHGITFIFSVVCSMGSQWANFLELSAITDFTIIFNKYNDHIHSAGFTGSEYLTNILYWWLFSSCQIFGSYRILGYLNIGIF